MLRTETSRKICFNPLRCVTWKVTYEKRQLTEDSYFPLVAIIGLTISNIAIVRESLISQVYSEMEE